MDHAEFEKEVMEKILDSCEKPYCILRHQYLNSTIVSREFTGAGFFTHFAVPDELAVPGMEGLIQDVFARFNNSDLIYLFVLFIRNGKIDCLEGFTGYGDWLYDYDRAILCYAYEDGRHHEIENFD